MALVAPLLAQQLDSVKTPVGTIASSTNSTADELPPIPPRSPAEALASLEVVAGFHVELVAHEPNVVSPVAATFDEQGRMYVAEMIDYPYRPAAGSKPLGTIRLLEDKNGDGFFETATVFADGLLWPTGVAPWDGGVFVAAAPDIWYLKDNDGDGRADQRQKIFSGFGIQNEQGSVNNLVWGLDGKIYGSSSKNGGQIRAGSDAAGPAFEVHGSDFLFNPRTLEFELISGNGQFGIAVDDWGNRFLCDQANPSQHVVLPRHYLARNPKMRVRDAVNNLCPGATPSFRLSPIEGWRAIRSSRRLESGERGAGDSGLSHDVLDGVAGPAIYRGDGFSADFRGQLFVGDAQSNLVHRRLLTPLGVTFESKRADPGTEFIRSGDNWFRPVNVVNAPDGTLYVIDMCREVIESVHVPLDVFKKIDYTRGRDRGRIYRIAPAGWRAPQRAKLTTLDTPSLVAVLEHRSGWWRDTAQRLLLERRDATAAEPLRQVVRSAELPESRTQALHTLAAFEAVRIDDLLVGSADEDPHVREHAIQLSEPYLSESSELTDRLLVLADDADARVRFQAAFSIGAIPHSAELDERAISALVDIAARDGGDPWFQAAIFSSSARSSERLLLALLELASRPNPSPGVLALLPQAAELAGASAAPDRIAACWNFVSQSDARLPPLTSEEVLVRLSEGWRAAGGTWESVAVHLSPQAVELRTNLIKQARSGAVDSSRSPAEQVRAVRVLGCAGFSEARKALTTLIDSPAAEPVKLAAVRSLAGFNEPEVATVLLTSWPRLLPSLRESILQSLSSRPKWIHSLLDAVAAGSIPLSQIGGTLRTTLLNHHDREIAERAGQLWNAANSPRAEVIAQYREHLNDRRDVSSGQKVYERECAACHELGKHGYPVGPNLALARHRTADELLIHILDPNREVQPAFVQYVVTDHNGGAFAGLLASDTPTSVTLRQDRNVERTILKSDIDELSSTDKSLMAEGFEKTITPQEMANLIAWLMQIRYDLGTDPGHEEPRGE